MAKARESTARQYLSTRTLGRGRNVNPGKTALLRVISNHNGLWGNQNWTANQIQPELHPMGAGSGDNIIKRKKPSWLK